MKNKLIIIFLVIVLSFQFTFSLNKYGKVISDCNIYSEQSINSKIVKKIEKDDLFIIFEKGKVDNINNKKNNWYKINCFENIGWIFGDWIEFDKDLPSITNYIIKGRYLKWGTEDNIIDIYFNFTKNNKVKIIEKSANKDKYFEYGKYEMYYASFYKNSINIFSNEPMRPLHIVTIENDEISVVTYATMGIDQIEKFDKEKIDFNIYLKPKVKNLRFRENPGINGKYLRTLDTNEKLLFIKYGEKEIINNIGGYWIQVKTENNEIGWCFDGYLKLM